MGLNIGNIVGGAESEYDRVLRIRNGLAAQGLPTDHQDRRLGRIAEAQGIGGGHHGFGAWGALNLLGSLVAGISVNQAPRQPHVTTGHQTAAVGDRSPEMSPEDQRGLGILMKDAVDILTNGKKDDTEFLRDMQAAGKRMGVDMFGQEINAGSYLASAESAKLKQVYLSSIKDGTISKEDMQSMAAVVKGGVLNADGTKAAPASTPVAQPDAERTAFLNSTRSVDQGR